VPNLAAISVAQIPNGTGTCSFYTIDRHSVSNANHITANWQRK
jgi:hypothetical protein